MPHKSLTSKQKLHYALGLAASIGMVLALVFSLQLRQKVAVAEPTVVFVPTGSSYEALIDSLIAHNCLTSKASFEAVARSRKLPDCVKGGRYEVTPGMSLFRLVNKLRSGHQDALHLTLGKQRTPQQMASFLASRLEMQQDSMLALLTDSATAASYGLTPQTMLCLFIPNTYDIYWNSTPHQLLDRMKKEYDRFWTPVRQGQCTALGMSPVEVITLASIVEEETNKDDEKSRIASVYLNRLRCGMLLQADPTVKYAVGDFTLRRILNKHLSSESPYNTYLHQGLPPGPICTPSIRSIDAVLENQKTDYLYFCAREDFSGYHNFASTLSEHMRNAARFHQALNQRGIK